MYISKFQLPHFPPFSPHTYPFPPPSVSPPPHQPNTPPFPPKVAPPFPPVAPSPLKVAPSRPPVTPLPPPKVAPLRPPVTPSLPKVTPPRPPTTPSPPKVAPPHPPVRPPAPPRPRSSPPVTPSPPHHYPSPPPPSPIKPSPRPFYPPPPPHIVPTPPPSPPGHHSHTIIIIFILLGGLFFLAFLLSMLEALDLSWNRLTGKIPQELTRMNFLSFLNLSQIHLVRPIPQGQQFNTFENDSYGGNLDLCGLPLTKKCGTSDSSHVPQQLESEEEVQSYFFSGFTWESVVIGYSFGLVVGTVMWSLMFKYRKPKWFVEFFDGLMPDKRRRLKKRVQRRRT